MHEQLTKPVEEKEVKAIFFSMQSDKSPGLDGMTSIFFKTFWNIISKDTILAIQSFFHLGFLLKSVNETLISFIPKVNNHTSPNQFRPISLCNMIYKEISKLLANKLKPLLHYCISPS